MVANLDTTCDNTLYIRFAATLTKWLTGNSLPPMDQWQHLYCSEDPDVSGTVSDQWEFMLAVSHLAGSIIDRHAPTTEYVQVSQHRVSNMLVLGVGVGCGYCSAVMDYYALSSKAFTDHLQ